MGMNPIWDKSDDQLVRLGDSKKKYACRGHDNRHDLDCCRRQNNILDFDVPVDNVVNEKNNYRSLERMYDNFHAPPSSPEKSYSNDCISSELKALLIRIISSACK